MQSVTGDKEILNYLRWLCRPSKLATGILVFACALSDWLLRRFASRRQRRLSMPLDVFALQQNVLRDKSVRNDFSGTDVGLGSICYPRLCLPGEPVQYTGQATWDLVFDDVEKTIALHRWGWLLRGLSDFDDMLSYDQGVGLMRSWLSACALRKDLLEDAYSTAERIANGALFLKLTGDGTIPEDIRQSFQSMARSVALQLEYLPGNQTGNHAFNNGRGIFIAGVIASDQDMISLANAIFRERLPLLVTQDGFLREASTHYHFLVTRWVLEIWWFAEAYQQVETEEIIGEYATKLVEQCWFFLVRSEETGAFDIPLIGDISPDFPPDWLLSLPWSSLATTHYKRRDMPRFIGKQQGWASLFGLLKGDSDVLENVTTYFPQSGWYRLSHGGLTLYCFAESTDGTLRANHKHDDLCSFVCFYRGEASIIDCGRLDYAPSIYGRYGKSINAHNSLTVDGMSPSVEPKSWVTSAYSAVRVTTSVSECESGIRLVLEHDGFRRIAGKRVTHCRKLILGRGSLVVEDALGGVESLDVRLRFHLAELSITGRDPKRRFDPRLRDTELSPGTLEGLAGLCVRQYGVPDQCTTYDLCGRFYSPTSVVNSFDWK